MTRVARFPMPSDRASPSSPAPGMWAGRRPLGLGGEGAEGDSFRKNACWSGARSAPPPRTGNLPPGAGEGKRSRNFPWGFRPSRPFPPPAPPAPSLRGPSGWNRERGPHMRRGCAGCVGGARVACLLSGVFSLRAFLLGYPSWLIFGIPFLLIVSFLCDMLEGYMLGYWNTDRY